MSSACYLFFFPHIMLFSADLGEGVYVLLLFIVRFFFDVSTATFFLLSIISGEVFLPSFFSLIFDKCGVTLRSIFVFL